MEGSQGSAKELYTDLMLSGSYVKTSSYVNHLLVWQGCNGVQNSNIQTERGIERVKTIEHHTISLRLIAADRFTRWTAPGFRFRPRTMTTPTPVLPGAADVDQGLLRRGHLKRTVIWEHLDRCSGQTFNSV